MGAPRTTTKLGIRYPHFSVRQVTMVSSLSQHIHRHLLLSLFSQVFYWAHRLVSNKGLHSLSISHLQPHHLYTDGGLRSMDRGTIVLLCSRYTSIKTILYCTGTSGAVLVPVQDYGGFACVISKNLRTSPQSDRLSKFTQHTPQITSKHLLWCNYSIPVNNYFNRP